MASVKIAGKADAAMTTLGEGSTSLPRIKDVTKIIAKKYKFESKEEAKKAIEAYLINKNNNASLSNTANELVKLGVTRETKINIG